MTEMNDELNSVLAVFVDGIKSLFGDKLKDIVLFGSYARGDFDSESDVDIAIIVDILKEDETRYHKDVVKLIRQVDDQFEYLMLLSPIILSYNFFCEWENVLPFYRNIKREGVRLIA